jgi:hypothetical protein
VGGCIGGWVHGWVGGVFVLPVKLLWIVPDLSVFFLHVCGLEASFPGPIIVFFFGVAEGIL